MLVLLVDDDPQLVRALAINLRARRHEVVTASDGASALEAASKQNPDVVVLDLGLPDMDGVDVVEGIRAFSSVPIIVLSARQEQAEKVSALDAGADDYVTKPFGIEELLARLRAAERRGRSGEPSTPRIVTDDFEADFGARRAERHGVAVHLTPTEWHVLEVLARHPGKVVPQRQLLQEVWGAAYGTESNYLRVYLAQLRRKLEPQPSRPRYFVTAPGLGYRFEP